MDTRSEPDILEFIRYNNWANQQVLEACLQLSPEQLATAIPGAFGSIRETLVHLVRAEASYVARLTGQRPQPPFDWDQNPGLAEVKTFAAQVGDALLDAVRRTRPTDLIHQDWDGKKIHYQAIALFIQIIDHGIEHRTNITTILNQGLGTPPAVDGWGYLDAHADRFDFNKDNA